MTIRNTLYVIAGLFLCTTQGKAQRDTIRRNQHFVGLALGPVVTSASYESPIGEIVFQGRHKLYGSLSVNYQYFFLKHWGTFIDFAFYDASQYHPEETISKMETVSHPYQYIYNRYYDKDREHIRPVFSAGIIYRKDIGAWCISPQIGFGLTRYFNANSISYYRKEEGSNQMEEISVDINNNGKGTIYAFKISPGIHISRTVCHGLSLTAGISYVIHPQTFTGNYRRCNAYTHEVLEQYEVKEKPGNHIHIKIGAAVWITRK